MLNLNSTPEVKEVKISFKEMVDKYCGNMVLANELFLNTFETCPEDLTVSNGSLYTYYNEYGDEISEDQYYENLRYGFDAVEEEDDVYQYFLIDHNTVNFLRECTDELVLSFPYIDAYFLGVKHFGMSWDDVYTTITLPR